MLTMKGMRFPKEIILLCVRWYAAYPLSYRNLEDMMHERGAYVITPVSTAGRSSFLRCWRRYSESTSGQSAPVGALMRPASWSMASGSNCIVRWERKAPPSISCSVPGAIRWQRLAFSKRRCAKKADPEKITMDKSGLCGRVFRPNRLLKSPLYIHGQGAVS